MSKSPLPAGRKIALVATVIVALLIGFALPNPALTVNSHTGAVLSQTTPHVQTNWGKVLLPSPTPLSNCIGTSGLPCFNTGTNLTWQLTLDVCSTTSTVCTGTAQLPIKLVNVIALLGVGEAYVSGSEQYTTSPSNTGTFQSGPCSSGWFPTVCGLTPNGTWLMWNFSSPTLNGHPQAQFSYNSTLTGPDNSSPVDYAIANFTRVNLDNNPIVDQQVFVGDPVLNLSKTCPVAVENNSRLTYDVTLLNTGHQDASGVTMVDQAPLGVTFTGANATAPTASFSSSQAGWTGTVLANGSVGVSIDANVNTSAHSVTNTANYTATPSAASVLRSFSSCTTLVLHPAISVHKTATPSPVSNLTPNTITVKAVVTNTGDTTLYNVTAVDSLAFALSCNDTTLAPGASTNCTGTYTIPAGAPANYSNDTVNTSGNDRLGTVVTAEDNASVRILHPAIAVVKAVFPTEVSNLVANTIQVYANVTNVGDAELFTVSVNDTLAGTLSCPTTPLAVGATETCTGSYVIPKGTTADFSNDTVTATARDQFSNLVGPETANASVEIVHPSLTVVKTVEPSLVSNLTANTIDVTANVTNTGDTTLFFVSANDSLAGALVCASTVLAPGASTNCTGSYTVPLGYAGNYSNDTVFATAGDGFGNGLNESSNASVVIVHPSLTVVKTVDPTVVSNLTANTIAVTANVTNTGDTTLYFVSVNDTLAGALTCGTTTLLPGQSTNCTGTYVIPKGYSGNYSNDTVTANAGDGFGNGVTDQDNASVQVVHPSLTVVKTVDPTLVSDLESNTITVTANVTNTGDTTLFFVSVNDSLAGPLTCGTTTLAPGESTNCTGTYVIPMGYAGNYSNDTVFATAGDGFGNGLSEQDNASVQVVHPSLTVVKTVVPTDVSNLTANTVNVTANVTNTGDTTLYFVSANDTLAGPLTCGTTTLLPGQSTNCTGSYVIPQGTSANFSNDTVFATAGDGFGNGLNESSNASVVIVHPSLTVVKTVDPTVVSNLTANTITVTANVTNTGDTTLYFVSVNDSLAGPLVCDSTVLAPGASTNCTGTYVIPMGYSGNYSNDTVTANAGDGFGNGLSDQANASVRIVHPGLMVVKSVSPTLVSDLESNTITVTANVTNTGDTTLFFVSVNDTLAGALTCGTTTLAPGQSTNCTGTYVIPKGYSADYSNDTATANAGDGFGNGLSAFDNASVQVVHPSLRVVKTVDPTVVSNLTANTITVTANVTNTGDTTLYFVSVNDTLAGALTCGTTTLLPGQSTNCTGTYVIPMGYAGNYSNDTVTATAGDGFGNGLSEQDNASVQVVHPSLTVVKTVDPTVVSNLTANTITVTANVTNTGDTTLYHVSVNDSLAGALTCGTTTLAPGQSTNCTGTYVIPKGYSGDYSNDTATANAGDGFGNGLSEQDNASVQVVHPSLTVVKVVDPTVVSNLTANTITVTANVTNTGDTTLYHVSANDSLAGALTCGSTFLAPGHSTNCTGTYVIPKGYAGDYSNDTVTANAGDGFGNDVTGNDSASVQVVHPSLTVVKVVDPTVVSNLVNNTITVTANVTNTGDTTLYFVSVNDSLAGALTCGTTTLAPGQSTNCTGTYVIPKGYAGDYSNDTATANAGDGFDNGLSGNDSASVQVVHPALRVVKTVDPTLVSNLTANVITVVANVTNTGDTTLYHVSVNDSLAGALTCGTTTLAPGQATNCTGTYVIPKGTSADFSNDTATASAGDGFGHGLSEQDNASVQIVHPSLSVVKSVDPTVVYNLVNNTITVTATVTNTGDATLYHVSVNDTLAGALTCGTTTLAPGQSTNCTGTYVIPKGTSADYSNDTVSAEGHDGFHNQVGPETANASVRILHPALTVQKVVSPTVVLNSANHTIDITATVTNTGDAPLQNLTVTDSIAGALSCPSTTLAVGASMNCTGSYVIVAGTPPGYSNDTVTATGCDAADHCLNDTSNASVQILPSARGQVTDTSFCPLPGGQFTILYRGTNFQITATNPGQFYYNVYSTAGMTHGSTLSVTIPYPFVTSGANPAQVFQHAPPSCPASPPNSNLNSEFSISPATFGLSAFSPQSLGSVVVVTFTLNGPSIAPGVQLWFAIHLNYGLKGQAFNQLAPGTSSCPSLTNTGPCAQLKTALTTVIGYPQSYTFSNSWSGPNTVTSVNSFVKAASPAAVSPAWTSSVLNPWLGVRAGVGLLIVVVGQVLAQSRLRPPAGGTASNEGTDAGSSRSAERK